MYVVRVVQGVHNRMVQPVGQAHAQVPAHGAAYSKESYSISSSRTTVLPIQGQLSHRTASDTLAMRSTAASRPPAMRASPHVVTTSPAHRVRTAAGMISCLWRPLRCPPALKVHPSSSRAQLMIHGTLDGSRSSAVIHLPQTLTGSSSSRRLIAAHTAAVLPLPPPAALRTAVWAVQRRFVPASSVLSVAAAAGISRERALQRIAAAAQGYIIHRGSNSSSSNKIMIRRSRSVVLLPAKIGYSGGANVAAPRSAPTAAAAAAAASSIAQWSADRSSAQGPSSSSNISSSRPAAVVGCGAGNSGAAGGATGSSDSGPPRHRPGLAAAATDSTGSFFPLQTASLKLARMGISLMGLAAAAALAAVFFSESRKSKVTDDQRSDELAPAAVAAAALPMHHHTSGSSSGADSYEGPVYYAWMEKRLQSALQQFDREQDMLRSELAMLQTLGKKVAGSGSSSLVSSGRDTGPWTDRAQEGQKKVGVLWSKMKCWFGRNNSIYQPAANETSGSSSTPPAAAAAGMSAEAISTRMAEIYDQIESLDVLRAALTAELLEQQRQQQRVDVQQMSQRYASLPDGH